MSSALTQYTLPDLLSLCPFEFSKPNPHLEECNAESMAWVTNFNILNDKHIAIMEKSQTSLISALTYPYAGREDFRMICDFINLLFILDHLSDDMHGKDARGACEVFYQVMANPDFKHDSLLERVTLEYAGSPGFVHLRILLIELILIVFVRPFSVLRNRSSLNTCSATLGDIPKLLHRKQN